MTPEGQALHDSIHDSKWRNRDICAEYGCDILNGIAALEKALAAPAPALDLDALFRLRGYPVWHGNDWIPDPIGAYVRWDDLMAALAAARAGQEGDNDYLDRVDHGEFARQEGE